MKRIILLSILIFMTVFFISCSNSTTQNNNENETLQTKTAKVDGDKSAQDVIDEVKQNSGMGINVSLGETGENLSLPESFPNDVFPLLDDASIVNVNDNKEAKAIGIVFETDKSYEEAVAFYQDIMKSGTITVEDKKDDTYILMGTKDKYGIMITISKYNGDDISVLINVSF